MVKLMPLSSLVSRVATWNPASSSGSFMYVDLAAVDQTRKRITDARELDTANAPSRARQIIASGDVLVSTVRPNLNAVAVVDPHLDGATASTGFSVLRPTSELSSQYLFHWVRSSMFIKDMVRKATGASYPAITDKIIRESLIPLPPIEEQRRIADILNRADALCAKRREALAHLDDLAQSLFFDMFGDPVVSHTRWDRRRLGDLLTSLDSGASPVCLDRPAGLNEWGVLKLGAVTRCVYVPQENKALPTFLRPRSEHEVRSGDVLFSRKNTRDLVAACAFVRNTPPRRLLPDLIFRLNVNPRAGLEPLYLQQLLVYPTKRRSVQKLAGGSAGSMPNISKARLREVLIEVPPPPLQTAFVKRLDAIEQNRMASTDQLDQLDEQFRALQRRAFAGAL